MSTVRLALTGVALALSFVLASPSFAQDALQFPVLRLPGPAASLLPADVDGDGRLDLVGRSDAAITTWFAGIDGSFSDTVSTVGARSFDASLFRGAVGDLDLDGELDLVGVETIGLVGWGLPTSRAITARRGGGDGTFEQILDMTRGDALDGLCVEDLDGDGVLDMLEASSSQLTRSRWSGSHFEPVQVIEASYPVFAPGDFDGDGLRDLFLAAVLEQPRIWWGRPAGVFEPGPSVDVGTFTTITDAVATDLDRDGLDDLVCLDSYDVAHVLRAGSDVLTEVQKFVVPKPDGIGVVTPLLAYPQLGLGDLDGDGLIDLVIGRLAAKGLYWRRGKPDGHFSGAQSAKTGYIHSHPQVADLDGDGRADVVSEGSTSVTNSRSALVLPGGATGPSSILEAGPVGTALDLAVGDVDGDGTSDVLTAEITASSSLTLRRGLGDGSVGVAEPVPHPGSVITRLDTGDVDGDGRADILAITGGPLLLLGLEPGELTLVRSTVGGFDSTTLAEGPATEVALSDVTGDGLLDAVWSRSTPPAVAWLQGDGSGGFDAADEVALAVSPKLLAIGDVDGDGHPDILASQPSTSSVVLLLGSAAGFVLSNEIAVAGSIRAMTLLDFDGSSTADLALVTSAPDRVVILCNVVAGGGAIVGLPVNDTPSSIAAGDLGRDGIDDLAVTLDNKRNVMVLRGGVAHGDPPISHFAVPSAARRVAIADLDADGWPDLLAQTEISLVSLLNQGRPIDTLHFASSPTLPLPRLTADGTPAPDAEIAFALEVPTPPLATLLVIGAQADFARLAQGGVLVPAPQLLVPFADAFVARWPHDLPSGTPLFAQAALATGEGLALSNALLLVDDG